MRRSGVLRQASFAIAFTLSSLVGPPGSGLGPSGALAQDSGEEEDPGDDDDPPSEDKPARPELTEREKQVLGLFNASSKRFEKGRIFLEYKFEARDDNILADWTPGLDTSTRSRLHWATVGELDQLEDSEGYYRRTKREYTGAIVLSDFGQWTHRAVFLPDLEVTVDLVNLAHPRPGTILGPVFTSEKKKQSLGVNGGYQAVCLSGWKPVKPPHPKVEKTIPWKVRQTLGYRYDGKSLESYINGKKVCDTTSLPRFTEGFDVGHPGLAWSGSVKCYVFRVVVSGRLDPDWVSQELKEKPEPDSRARGAGAGAGGAPRGKNSPLGKPSR